MMNSRIRLSFSAGLIADLHHGQLRWLQSPLEGRANRQNVLAFWLRAAPSITSPACALECSQHWQLSVGTRMDLAAKRIQGAIAVFLAAKWFPVRGRATSPAATFGS